MRGDCGSSLLTMTIADQLRRDEGVRAKPYVDTVGKVTIGVGRNLTDNGLSDIEIDILLTNDIAAITSTLSSRLPYFDSLDPVRQAVLVNMGFNIGFEALDNFPNMLAAVAQGRFNDAADEMLDSKWASQVGDRAKRLSMQMKTGVWQ